MHLVWRPVHLDGGPPIDTSITEAEAARLGELATNGQVLEVGSAFGFSAVVFGRGGADHVDAVDPHVWLDSAGTMRRNLDAYGVADRVTVHQRSNHDVLPWLHEQGSRYDLVFIDGDHRRPAVDFDLFWALRLVAPSGVIAVHDYDERCCCPDVAPAVDALLATQAFNGHPSAMTDTMLELRP